MTSEPRILCGIETEYGIAIEGRGPEDQIQDVAGLVCNEPGLAFSGWDDRDEHPRRDLRGFSVDRLSVDPRDQAFETRPNRPSDRDLRQDRITERGARFYNDHGHPEYATPECWTAHAVAWEDLLGEKRVALAARAFSEKTGQATETYKNNTDFHGASYGTHESYLVPRTLAAQDLVQGLLPLLVTRPMLCGAGKVGSENGDPCPFQLSQRADFFMEPVNVETLYRRPLFNTRDEPHAPADRFIRLHVIAGDANRIFSATRRKVFLVQLAIRLLLQGQCPVFKLKDPVQAAKVVSRDLSCDARLPLEGASWTTAPQVLESYLAAAEATLTLTPAESLLLTECRGLLDAFSADPDHFAVHVDWAAKLRLTEWVREDEGYAPGSPELQSIDLAYAEISTETTLFSDLIAMEHVEAPPALTESALPQEPTRAWARALAVQRFREHLTQANWRGFTLAGRTIELLPDRDYAALAGAHNVEDFINLLEQINA